MKLSSISLIATLTGLAAAAAVEKAGSCSLAKDYCSAPTDDDAGQSCCEFLECHLNRCYDPRNGAPSLPTAREAEQQLRQRTTPEGQCLKLHDDCYVNGVPAPHPCCDGLICAANKCRRPQLTQKRQDDSKCLAEWENCYVNNVPVPEPCCGGLICAADKCRDPNKEGLPPTKE